MTLIKPIQDSEAVDECVKAAKRGFLRTIRLMEAITDKVEREEMKAIPGVKPVSLEVVAATRQLLTEHARVHEMQKKQVGVVHDFAIDFDAARDEIRLRLACLRSAGDG